MIQDEGFAPGRSCQNSKGILPGRRSSAGR